MSGKFLHRLRHLRVKSSIRYISKYKKGVLRRAPDYFYCLVYGLECFGSLALCKVKEEYLLPVMTDKVYTFHTNSFISEV
jgi:hypothetical protein